MEALQRTRAPYLLALHDKLRTDAGMHMHEDNTHNNTMHTDRLMQVWLHLIMITYYVGTTDFLEQVLFCDSEPGCPGFWPTAIAYVQGSTDDYNTCLHFWLLRGALTHSTIRRFFNPLDGTRIPWKCIGWCLKGY